MFAGTHTGSKIVNVGPLSFPIAVNGSSPDDATAKVNDLLKRHSCIANAKTIDQYEILGSMPYYQVVQLTMDEEADYQQICTLRAETLGEADCHQIRSLGA